MSINIAGRPDDSNAAAEASFLAADVLYENGTNAMDAYTLGSKAAQYGGEIALKALRNMGLLEMEIDQEAFKAAVGEVRAEVFPDGMPLSEAEDARNQEMKRFREGLRDFTLANEREILP